MADKKKIIPDRKIVKVELEKLKLDISNVRYQHIDKTLNEEEIEKEIWKEADTVRLYEQIKSTKGLYEKPIIDSGYNVHEGNRRVVCLRRLKREAHTGTLPGFGEKFFDKVECEQLLPGTTEEQIKLLLASIHVKGKKPWPTFNRAKQIYELHNAPFNHSYDYLTAQLGMGKTTVIRAVAVYEQTKRYHDNYPEDNEWYRKYTYFDELYKKRDLKEFTEMQENVDMFARWITEKKFSNDVRLVRNLGEVLKSKDAFNIFEKKDMRAAMDFLNRNNPAVKSREFKKIAELTTIIQGMSRKEILKTARDPNRRKMIVKLRTELDALLRDIDSAD
jgi:hypothetical protein